MKKLLFGMVLLALVMAVPSPTIAMGRVDVGVSIPLPPPIGFAGPPEMVVIPETYIYVAPDVDVDVFFYGGWWWRPWEGRWYRSQNYNSGWGYYEGTPSFYGNVPSGWRNDYRQRRWGGHQWNYQRIPQQQVQRNWQGWERDRYWEKQNTWGVRDLRRPQTRPQQPAPRVSLPPAITFSGSPSLVVIPETNVYVVPDVDVDVFFYGGWWWRPWEGRWYRSQNYSSGWGYYQGTPSFYGSVPSGWRNDYRQRRWQGRQWNYQRIPQQQVQQNWKGWERDKYWEKQNTWGVRDLRKPQTQQPSRQMQQRQPETQSRDYQNRQQREYRDREMMDKERSDKMDAERQNRQQREYRDRERMDKERRDRRDEEISDKIDEERQDRRDEERRDRWNDERRDSR